MVKITIIVPMYNSEEFIRKTLDSLVAQTCDSIEILVIDDGSTDASPQIADEYANYYAHLRVIHKENGRFPSAINRGLDEAKGEYIGFVESDDWVDPETYECLLQVAEDQNLDFVRGDYLVERKNGTTKRDFIRSFHLPVHVVTNLKTNPEIAAAQMGYWAGIYKRSLIEKYNIRLIPDDNIPLFQDYFFVTRTLIHATRGMFVEKYFYHYNNIPDDQSIKNVKYPDIMERILGMQKKYFQDNNIKLDPYSEFLFYLFPLAFNVNRLTDTPEEVSVKKRAGEMLKPLYDSSYFDKLPQNTQNDIRNILLQPTLSQRIKKCGKKMLRKLGRYS